jgi:hypothetical protein
MILNRTGWSIPVLIKIINFKYSFIFMPTDEGHSVTEICNSDCICRSKTCRVVFILYCHWYCSNFALHLSDLPSYNNHTCILINYECLITRNYHKARNPSWAMVVLASDQMQMVTWLGKSGLCMWGNNRLVVKTLVETNVYLFLRRRHGQDNWSVEQR